jgi:aryl-alcohol dehydrogenase-like predicted oxidoreductase
MEDLMRIAAVVEADLRGLALSFRSSLKSPENWRYSDLLQEQAAAMATAWEMILRERGIDPATMEKALPEKHPSVAALLKLSEGMEEPEQVKKCLAVLNEFFS